MSQRVSRNQDISGKSIIDKGALTKVVFLLQKEAGRWQAGRLLAALKAAGIQSVLYNLLEDHTQKEDAEASVKSRSLERAEAAVLREKEQAGVLYVTDSGICHRFLCEKGLAAIAYLHEDNRKESFSMAAYAIEKIEEIEPESLELAYLRLTGQPWTILETDRCVIRETTLQDIDAFYEIYKEPSITYYMENLYQDI